MSGRWPANVILSPAMAEALDEQSGNRPGFQTQRHLSPASSGMFGRGHGAETKPEHEGYNDSGGASRFFLNAGYEAWELEWIYANGLRPCGE